MTPKSTVFNIPNQITCIRLILACIMFGLIPGKCYLAALVVFAVAAGTDWLDGYWARKYNQVTQLGRILDPFVDKFIICGAFIFLVAERDSGISAWMAVVVVSRELLVTVIRGFLEQHGADFSAQLSGKLKMVLQCFAVILSLLSLKFVPPCDTCWLGLTRDVFIWLSIFSTLQSGISYIFRAVRLLRE
jgi:CDP-diacylglycerol--glycerol-3-phosphate 3-phosphatidyltransferase